MFWFPFFRAFMLSFFTSNLQFLLVGAQTYFLTSGTWYPSYATDKIIEVDLV